MGIVCDIYRKWKNAEDDKEALAYMDCYFMITEYIQDRQYCMAQEMKKYHNARLLADKVVEAVKDYEKELERNGRY